MKKIIKECGKTMIVIDTDTNIKTWECKDHGSTIIKVPFDRNGGMYCYGCHPSQHIVYQEEKAKRLAKMNFGKKKTGLVGLLNSFAEQESGG